MLHCEHYPATVKHQGGVLPTLVFLHGLLGDGRDWLTCINELSQFDCVTIDLPGHGGSQSIQCHGLNDCCKQITTTLSSLFSYKQPLILIGYSMGGRIAMHGLAKQAFSDLNIGQVIIEGGNFGLQKESDKQARLDNDRLWATRFKAETIEEVLNDWYQQSVFSSLNHEQRQTLVAKRSANLGAAVANMLMATSLAKQSYLLPDLQQQSTPIFYLCGEKDEKFSQLAQSSGLAYRQIKGAGHNVHQEQPKQFAIQIQQFIHSHFSGNEPTSGTGPNSGNGPSNGNGSTSGNGSK